MTASRDVRSGDRLLDLEVTGYANGGSGIARSSGRVVFVTGALPGERVRARITDDRHAAYAKAEVVDVIEPSDHRIQTACAAAAAGAGCCDLAFVAPDHARELGEQALADVLRRIGGFDLDDLAGPRVRPLADASAGWRVRTRLAVGRDGEVGLRGRRSSAIVTAACAAPVSGLLDDVAGLGAAPQSELVLMSDADGARHAAEVAAPVHRRSAGARRGDRARRRTQQARGARAAVRSVRMLDGDASVVHRVGERSWEIPVTGFWQAHRGAPGAYSETVLDMLAEVGIGGTVHAWDLYGGVGVFSAALLDGGAARGFETASVDLVDSDAGALAAAAQTFRDDPVRSHRGAVADLLGHLRRPDVVVADPPRGGSGADVVDAVAAAQPRAVVHVGCDPAAFARDLGRFAVRGYRVRDWVGFDAFPMTHHVEAIAVLTP